MGPWTMIERPDEFEEAWARIVAELTSDREDPATAQAGLDLPPEGTDPTASPTDADPETWRSARLSALFSAENSIVEPPATPPEGVTDPAAFVDGWHDEGHFVPPPPPELPEGTPLTRLGWVGLLGGPAILLILALTGWDVPRVVAVGAGAITLAGFLTLVWHLPDSRPDSGWDDGAQL